MSSRETPFIRRHIVYSYNEPKIYERDIVVKNEKTYALVQTRRVAGRLVGNDDSVGRNHDVAQNRRRSHSDEDSFLDGPKLRTANGILHDKMLTIRRRE